MLPKHAAWINDRPVWLHQSSLENLTHKGKMNRHASLSFKKQKGLNDAAGTTSASCMKTCGAFLILKAARPGGAWGEAGEKRRFWEIREAFDIEIQDGLSWIGSVSLVLSRRPMNPCPHRWKAIWEKTDRWIYDISGR